MKIAIDARIIYTTTGRYVEKLLDHLQTIDRRNHYVVLLTQKNFDRWQPSAPNFTKVVADYPIYTLREQFQFAWLLYRLRVDLVHFTMPQRPLLYFGRHVVTIHDLTLLNFVNRRRRGILKDVYSHYIKPPAFRFLLWVDAYSARHIIAPCHYVADQIMERYPVTKGKTASIYDAADTLEGAVRVYPLLKNKRYLLHVGNVYPHKNIPRLIEAFAKLKQDDVWLVLVGKSDYFFEQMQALVKKRRIQRVMFTGFVSDEELKWLYRHAELYVLPSLSEGFGLPGLEAMANGAPVVAAQAGSLPEVYGNGAVYFDPYDVDSIATVITGILDDKSGIAELKKRGQIHVKAFSWERTARQTLEVYQKSLE